MKVLNCLNLAFVILAVSGCSNPANNSSANPTPPPIGDSKPENLFKTSARAKELVKSLKGKKLILLETVETDTYEGKSPSGKENPEIRRTSATSLAQETGCQSTAADGKKSEIPCDNILSFSFDDEITATVTTQTSDAKKMVTSYSEDSEGKLVLNLIEQDAKSIYYRMGGTVLVEGVKFVLRLKNSCSGVNINTTVNVKCDRVYDRVFEIR